MTTSQTEPRVYVQLWEESERGWGVRPDGASVHLSEAQAKAYIEAYWSYMPNRTPDAYSRPCGGSIAGGGKGSTYEYKLETGYRVVAPSVVEALRAAHDGEAGGRRFNSTHEAFRFVTEGA